MRRFGKLSSSLAWKSATARCMAPPSFGSPKMPLYSTMRYSSSAVPPSDAEVARIVSELEADGKLLEEVMEKMQPEHRRRLVVAGGALEWFGREHVEREVSAADADNDRVISPKDFDKWFESALKRKAATADAATNEDTSGASAASAAAAAASSIPVPFASLCLIALEAGLPFVGFGFLDNAIMILAGDVIDRTLGFYLHCSVLASAAMGNVVSGMMGMQVHGGVEKLIQRLNLPTPVMTEEQRKSQRVFLAGHIGGTIGIAIGLSLGMSMLFFAHDEEEKVEMIVFDKLDRDGNGKVSIVEIKTALVEMEIDVDSQVIDDLVHKHANGKDALTLSQFKELCSELKSKVQ